VAKSKKRTKDLDPKGSARSVRGGALEHDQDNINGSVKRIKTAVTDKVTRLPQDGVRLNP
jgi:hypothetical protein